VRRHTSFDSSATILQQSFPFSTSPDYQDVFHGFAGQSDDSDDYASAQKFLNDKWLDGKWFGPKQHGNESGPDSPVKFSPNHERLVSLAPQKTEKTKKRKSTAGIGSEQDKRRKTKWNVEPMLSKMRNALRCIRIEKISTTMVSRSFGIPTRTLRRYVNFSKDPEDKLFFMKVAEEKEENDEEQSQVENQEVDSEDEEFVPVSWKPQTTVPMFALYTDDAESTNDAKPATTLETAYPMVVGVPNTGSASCAAPEISIGEIDGLICNGSASPAPAGILDVTEFDSFDTASPSTLNLFDSKEFDDVFQDFCDDMLSSNVF